LNFTSCGSVLPVAGTDMNLANNNSCVTAHTVASFDPNDKSVSPIGVGNNGGITLQDSVLDYVIRFQNTGTSEAMNIKILDTLSTKLNIHSFQVKASSHNYILEVLDSNILQFKFKDINLPDSNTNEPLSHGFIAYRIHQKAGNIMGDEIKNTASIYFDFNSPVVTNTTLNTIISPTSVTFYGDEISLHVYPVPATNELYIQLKGMTGKQVNIEIIDQLGKIATYKTFGRSHDDLYKLSVSDIASGLYELRISDDSRMKSRKIVVDRK